MYIGVIRKLRNFPEIISYTIYKSFARPYLDYALCSCSRAIEHTVHYFLHFPIFSTARNTFLNEIAIVDRSIIDQDEIKVIQTFFILSIITN